MQCFIHIEKVLNYFKTAKIKENKQIAYNLKILITSMDHINHQSYHNNVSPCTFRKMICIFQ